MHPVVFEITIPGVLPRFSWLLSLAIALSVLGLAALIRARRSATLGILTAACALALVLANRRTAAVELVVSPFGVSLAMSIALGSWLVTRAAARIGITKPWSISWLSLGLIGGFLGSRLGYALIRPLGWPAWRGRLDFNAGGMFGYGAYFGGLLLVTLAARGQYRALRSWLDSLSPVLLLCAVLVRLGCYLEGCDFGRPLGPKAPYFIRILGTYPRWQPDRDGSFSGPAAWVHHVSSYGLSTDAVASLPTHPSPLYEAAFALLLASIAITSSKSKHFAGRTFLVTAIGFSAGRYLLEFLRGDPERGLMSLAHINQVGLLGSWSQLFALLSIVAAALGWRKWQKIGKSWSYPSN